MTTAGTGVDPSVLRIARAYDDYGRLEKITSYDDDEAGNVVNDIKYHFDDWGSVSAGYQEHTEEVDDDGEDHSPAVGYAYENDAPVSGKITYRRLDYLTYPSGRSVYYNYPGSGIGAAMNRLDNMANNGSGTTKYAQYTYLGSGTIVKVSHPAVSGGLNLTYGTGGTYDGFDRFGRVIDQKWENDSSTVKDRFTYTYDRNGNRLTRTNELHAALSEDYDYDGLNRLVDADRNSSDYQHWTLTQTGNWAGFDAPGLTQTRTHSPANEITGISGGSWIDPVHDKAGNMKLAPRPGDEATAGEALVLVYDAWNRLAKAYKDADEDGDGVADGGDTLIATYAYDARNRRVGKTVGQTTTEYHYNSRWQVVEERRGELVYAQYVWDETYIDSPAERRCDLNGDGDFLDANEVLYYCYDANRCITALVNASGVVVERYSYDAYGKPTFYDGSWNLQQVSGHADGTASLYGNEILYCGYRYDPETGLYQVRNRYYHPTLGAWITRDPKDANLPGGGYQDGGSLYEYVRSDPIAYRDSMGERITHMEDCDESQKAMIQEAHAILEKKLPLAKAAMDRFTFQWVFDHYIFPKNRDIGAPDLALNRQRVYENHQRDMQVMFQKMIDKVNAGIGFECECSDFLFCDGDTYAYTWRLFGGDIHLCPEWFHAGFDRDRNLVHEMSHFFGADHELPDHALAWAYWKPPGIHKAASDTTFLEMFYSSVDRQAVEEVWVWQRIWPPQGKGKRK